MPSTQFAEGGRPLTDTQLPLAAAAPCASGRLREGALNAWALRVSDIDVAELDASLLDADETRAAADLRRLGDRRSYIAAHVLLRQLLSRHLEVTASEIGYVRRPCPHCGGPHGRPELSASHGPLHFSLSRTPAVAVVAIASAPVGVDVEALPEDDTVDEVSALLHPDEREEILSAPRSRRRAVFARVWTRKEAYLKGIGIGVTHNLAADYVGAKQSPAAPAGWTILDVPVDAGHAAAVAVAGPFRPDPPVAAMP